VAQRDGRECLQDDALAPPVKAERHGEQPAHCGIDAVKKAEAGKRQPRPRVTYG
jgi:hypothetical protein